MTLYLIGDRYSNYKDRYFSGGDLKGMAVYSANGKRVGQVVDILIDDTDEITYLVVALGRWPGRKKKVILPAQSYAYNSGEDTIYVHKLSKDNINALPVYDRQRLADDSYVFELRQLQAVMEKDYSQAIALPTK